MGALTILEADTAEKLECFDETCERASRIVKEIGLYVAQLLFEASALLVIRTFLAVFNYNLDFRIRAVPSPLSTCPRISKCVLCCRRSSPAM